MRFSWDFNTRLLRAADGGSSGGSAQSSGGTAGPGGSSGSGASGAAGGAPSTPAGSSGSGSTTPSTSGASPGASTESRPTKDSSGSGGAPPSRPATPAVDQLDFAALFGDSPDEVFSGLTPTPPKAEAEPVAGAEPAQKVPPVPKAEPAQPEPKVAPSAAPTEATSQAGEASLDLSDPVSLASAVRREEAKFIEYAAQQAFSLTPEEVESLETDVVGTIPKLLAKVFVRSQLNMLDQLGRMTPGIISRHTDAVKRNSEAEAEFYGMWPDLKPQTDVLMNGQKTKLEMVVRQYAAVYRQMHPQATKEQMFAQLGPMVMMAANIVPTTGRTQPTTSNGRAAPAPSQPGFVPAAAGAGPVGQSTQVELSPIEAMFSFRDD